MLCFVSDTLVLLQFNVLDGRRQLLGSETLVDTAQDESAFAANPWETAYVCIRPSSFIGRLSVELAQVDQRARFIALGLLEELGTVATITP